jgi:hypothetical protein
MFTIQFNDRQYTPLNTSDRMFASKEEAQKKIAKLSPEDQKKCTILHFDVYNLFGISEVK